MFGTGNKDKGKSKAVLNESSTRAQNFTTHDSQATNGKRIETTNKEDSGEWVELGNEEDDEYSPQHLSPTFASLSVGDEKRSPSREDSSDSRQGSIDHVCKKVIAKIYRIHVYNRS
jgi:hypothetical protein